MATTSVTVTETPRLQALLARADDALVLGHRLSEWTGHAPMLEEELALANIALDLIGQARALYSATGEDEDRLAYLRDPGQFRNALIMELPNGDFAFTIARLLLVSAASDLYWRAAAAPPVQDADLGEIAAKAEKETAYHLRYAAEWLIRCGDGTVESHRRAQDALNALWPYVGELFEPDGLGPAIARSDWDAIVTPIIARATLRRPQEGWMQSGGRNGRHTEHLGHMLAVMQVLPRTYPGATW